MKFKIFFLIIGIVTPVKEYAQTAINRTIPVQSGQSIVMHFDYPELIRVTTWDKNEIGIEGSVSINGGENDEAFVLENTTSGNVIRIHSEIRGLKELPKWVTVIRDGQKIMFRDRASLQKYQQEHGTVYQGMSWGPDIDIQIEVKVPRNTETHVESVYGMVEIKNFKGPLDVEATYGGVDASLAERSVGELTAETNYGQIYSNLDIKFSGDQASGRDFYTFVSAKPGTGPKYTFESKYGNVYLRKEGN
ncbi:MAG: hypothetical protein WA874_02370 [Chryseosolibacter sp.]